MSSLAVRVAGIAGAFAVPVQLEEGEGAKRWLRTRSYLDHAGVEMVLRDVVPRRWQRNLVRELVCWVRECESHERTAEPELVEGLEDWDAVADRWSRRVRAWV